MGKGDKKSGTGKLAIGSNKKTRPARKQNIASLAAAKVPKKA